MSRKTRKLIWSAPLVAVLAVAGALTIFVALGPNSAQAHDLPGVVANLTAEADGQNAIDLSWDAPASGGTPTSYRIDRSLDGNTWMTHVMGHTTRSYSDPGLKPGTSYYYRVFAVNSAGTGPVSQDYQVQTDAGAPPSAVIRLAATPIGQNQVNLTWMAPAKLNGSPVEKYFIHFGSGDAPQIPARTEEADNDGVIEVAAEDGMSYEHKKLMAATRYSYIVYAQNATGKSTVPSNTAAATTAPLVKPGAPTGVTAVQTGDRDFTLYWFAPTETGGTDVIGYEVQASYNGGAFAVETGITWTNAAGTSADSVAHTVAAQTTATPAVDITRVQYRVYAITRNADTTATPPVTELKSTGYGQSQQMTIIAVDARPGLVPAAPAFATGSQASRDPKGNVNLEWTAPDIDSTDNDLTNNNAPDSIGGYRIDVSDDGINWRRLVNHTRRTTTKYQYVDPERKDRHYRIFAWHAQYLGPAQTNVGVSALVTGDPVPPDHVTGFTATAVGPTQIDLAWTAPQNDGGAPIVRYQIAGVRQAADNTFAAFPTAATTAEGLLFATSKTTGYMHKDLNAGETWQYQVLTVTDDGSDSGNIRTAVATTAETRRATTHQAALPEAPEGLVAEDAVAEDAKDSSNTGTADRGVLLLWNAPNPPDGAEIDGYRVQRMKDGGAWETLVADTNNVFTDYTDTSEPEAGELRGYRVAALNGNKMGAWSNVVYYPAMHSHIMVPGMPTASAMANSDSQITVSWTAPADNGSAITGYIIERRYTGDMVNDIPSDGYNDAAGGASFAFSNHKEWWETLNCKGMLAAAGSSADHTDMSDADVMMYCAHYADTEPTNMAGTIMDGDATDMAIQALFNKRYVLIDDAMTMMHVDMGLMADTTYTYRVSAVNSKGRGMWSAPTMATTEMAPAELMPPSNIRVNPVGSGGVIAAWDSVSGATGYRIIAINVNNVDETHSEFVNNPTATSGGLDGLTPGQTYNIFVASFDDADPPNYSLQPRFRQIVAE